MRPFTRLFLFAPMLLLPALSLFAQNAVDPSGHWAGSVQTPRMEVKVEFDLEKRSPTMVAGTFGQPEQGVHGLPISAVALDGRSIVMIVKADASTPATFDGELSEDGTSISGNMSQLDYSFPFTLTRTGDAKIAPAPKSRPIARELEGTWNGTLDSGDKKMRLIVKMANQPDGTATGTVVSPDGSGVPIPIAMIQDGSSLTIDIPSVNASFVGKLSTDGTELSGTFTQAGIAVPLTFRHEVK